MAQNEIKIRVKIDDKGDLSIVSKKAKQAADSTEKLTSSRDRYQRGEKGVAGATSNSTKAFSKMQQTMGSGSSGLVAAYATLAANIFALTAAFGVLRRAAAFEQLTAGLNELGAAAGKNLPFTAKKLQEITDGAISAEQALRATAVASSAGFSTDQLEKLTKVAKGASIALGRDMGDALDRLVRGTAKLEPEILDELGIIVRLDDATREYAATLGKTAAELTTFERQQAFLNATTEQGIKKFGDIADALDANPYDKLAASFANLSQEGLKLANKVLVPIVDFLSQNPYALLGVLILFTRSIASNLLPSLGAIALKYKEVGAAAAKAFKASSKIINREFVAQQQAVGKLASSIKVLPPSIQKMVPAFKSGTASAKEINFAVTNLKKSEALRQVALKKYTGETLAAKKLELAAITELRIATEGLQAAESKRLVASTAGSAAGSKSRSGKRAAAVFDKIASSGALGGTLAALKGTKLEFRDTMRTFAKESKTLKRTAVLSNLASNSLRALGLAARFAGAAFLNAIPFVGQFLFLLSTIAAFVPDSIIEFFTGANKVVDDATERFENFGKVASKLDQYLAGDRTAVEAGNATLKARIGLMESLSASINDVIENSESEAEARDNAALAAQRFFKEITDSNQLDTLGKEGVRVVSDIIKAMNAGKDTGTAQQLIENFVKPLASVSSSIEAVGGQISEVKTAFADLGRSSKGPMSDVIQRLKSLDNEAKKASEGVQGLTTGLSETDLEDLSEVANMVLELTGQMPEIENAAGVLANEIERLDTGMLTATEKSKELLATSKQVGKVAKSNAAAAALQVDLENQALDQSLYRLNIEEKLAMLISEETIQKRELERIESKRNALEATRVSEQEKSLRVLNASVAARSRVLGLVERIASEQERTVNLEEKAEKAKKSLALGRDLTQEENFEIELKFIDRKAKMEDIASKLRIASIQLEFLLLKGQFALEQQRTNTLKQMLKAPRNSSESNGAPGSQDRLHQQVSDAISTALKALSVSSPDQARPTQQSQAATKLQIEYANALGVSIDGIQNFVNGLTKNNQALSTTLSQASSTVRTNVIEGIQVFSANLAALGGEAGEEIASAFVDAGSKGSIRLSEAATGFATALPSLSGIMLKFQNSIKRGTLTQEQAQNMVQMFTDKLSNLTLEEQKRIDALKYGDKSARTLAIAVIELARSKDKLANINKNLDTLFTDSTVKTTQPKVVNIVKDEPRNSSTPTRNRRRGPPGSPEPTPVIADVELDDTVVSNKWSGLVTALSDSQITIRNIKLDDTAVSESTNTLVTALSDSQTTVSNLELDDTVVSQLTNTLVTALADSQIIIGSIELDDTVVSQLTNTLVTALSDSQIIIGSINLDDTVVSQLTNTLVTALSDSQATVSNLELDDTVVSQLTNTLVTALSDSQTTVSNLELDDTVVSQLTNTLVTALTDSQTTVSNLELDDTVVSQLTNTLVTALSDSQATVSNLELDDTVVSQLTNTLVTALTDSQIIIGNIKLDDTVVSQLTNTLVTALSDSQIIIGNIKLDDTVVSQLTETVATATSDSQATVGNIELDDAAASQLIEAVVTALSGSQATVGNIELDDAAASQLIETVVTAISDSQATVGNIELDDAAASQLTETVATAISDSQATVSNLDLDDAAASQLIEAVVTAIRNSQATVGNIELDDAAASQLTETVATAIRNSQATVGNVELDVELEVDQKKLDDLYGTILTAMSGIDIGPTEDIIEGIQNLFNLLKDEGLNLKDLITDQNEYNDTLTELFRQSEKRRLEEEKIAAQHALQLAQAEDLRDLGDDRAANLLKEKVLNEQISTLRKEIADLIRSGQKDSIDALNKEIELTEKLAEQRKQEADNARRTSDRLAESMSGGLGALVRGMGDVASASAKRKFEEGEASKETGKIASLKEEQLTLESAPETEESKARLKEISTEIDAAEAKLEGFQQSVKAASQEVTRATLSMVSTSFAAFSEEMKALGPEGEFISALSAGAGRLVADFSMLRDTIIDTLGENAVTSMQGFFDAWNSSSITFEQKAQIIAGALSMVGNAIGAINQMQQARANQAVSVIDKEIRAEQKRDGQSAASVAKIKKLEAQKDKIKRKAFEQDKKMKMGQVVMATASAIMNAMATVPFPGNIAIAAMAAAMGAAQLAAISSTSYQGGTSSPDTGAAPTTISVGGDRRTSTDLAKSQGAAGELAYFRGARGIGGPENFRPAASGMKYRANGGNTAFMVGEQGPEMFVPERPGTIVPADETAQLGTPINANINISALDAEGVEDILINQRGNIINMLRDAANASGETFLESVSIQEI